ncbi:MULTISPECIES: GntR family transcriptional regulator [Sphingobium]|uniref:GntR family transcriptional regulator n=1 Tax=Sphingobium TaxID=165695 RepID=UPI000DBB2F0B|nr:GntR family transcriptional regulator [Sphingobium sp. YG1]BBD02270.1 hypothetical protein YGS_C2P0283 [Sphingobium sp. YG1]
MKRSNLMGYTEVYVALGTSLANGQMKPGERINTAALAKKMDVSTTLVWEALAQLAGRDVVEKRKGEGFHFVRLSGSAIADLYRIHGFVIDLALERWVPMTSLRMNRDPWIMFDKIVTRTSDAGLLGIARYLNDRMRMFRRYERKLVDGLPSITSELTEALKAGKIEEARKAGRHFHDQCQAAAPQLSEAYNDARQSPIT